MRFIFANLLLVCLLGARAQGPQQLVDVPYDSWAGATVKAWLYLPADYATSTRKYPVVFYYHGLGEAGNNPYSVLTQGLPKLISEGMRPDNVVNPVDGQPYSFIVLSAQHWSWSPNPLWLPYQLEWLKQNYRIDTNRVYVTGLSAGGQQSYGTASQYDHVSKLIAAAVPMSPAQVWPYNPTLVGQYKIKTWFFSGNSDGGYTQNAINYNNDCNSQLPSSSRLNIYSGGHCCWTTYYNTNWRDPATNQSIWHWMLMQTREVNSTLPVNFVKLEAKNKNGRVQVSWHVAEERDVDMYEVERSRDGYQFSKTGSVPAAGRSSYSFTESPANARVYYRVKSVDYNGSFKYSSIVAFDANGAAVINAFPSPAQGYTLLHHPEASPAAELHLYTADGRLVQRTNVAEKSLQTRVDLSLVQKGYYFLNFKDGQVNETVRIIKQ
jgi:hypothetical protein